MTPAVRRRRIPPASDRWYVSRRHVPCPAVRSYYGPHAGPRPLDDAAPLLAGTSGGGDFYIYTQTWTTAGPKSDIISDVERFKEGFFTSCGQFERRSAHLVRLGAARRRHLRRRQPTAARSYQFVRVLITAAHSYCLLLAPIFSKPSPRVFLRGRPTLSKDRSVQRVGGGAQGAIAPLIIK